MNELNQKPAVDAEIMSAKANLEELIKYQSGAVVSRTLIKKPAGTVTIFAFDDGEGLSEHAAPFDAMVYCMDGKAEIIIGGTPFQLSKGETIVMPANIPHAVKTLEKFKMMLIMLKQV